MKMKCYPFATQPSIPTGPCIHLNYCKHSFHSRKLVRPMIMMLLAFTLSHDLYYRLVVDPSRKKHDNEDKTLMLGISHRITYRTDSIDL